ncbi:transporter [Ganoderma sinense ZZ0214-1]|uniref:Transporter n=1 Tax=Ganoderma sinense ZZ0214-1 TaxID=1077348 RepID=A0A2G8RWK2_9APHY|nr:transporter [Ganoderma sinense ZZ0214-1]
MNSRGGSATALRRLMTEYKQLTSQGAPDGMFTAGPISESDFFTWEALIVGPKDTPFEGGVFPAILTFPSDYPLSPFKMKFDPPLFHPNSTSRQIQVLKCGMPALYKPCFCLKATTDRLAARRRVHPRAF